MVTKVNVQGKEKGRIEGAGGGDWEVYQVVPFSLLSSPAPPVT